MLQQAKQTQLRQLNCVLGSPDVWAKCKQKFKGLQGLYCNFFHANISISSSLYLPSDFCGVAYAANINHENTHTKTTTPGTRSPTLCEQ